MSKKVKTSGQGLGGYAQQVKHHPLHQSGALISAHPWAPFNPHPHNNHVPAKNTLMTPDLYYLSPSTCIIYTASIHKGTIIPRHQEVQAVNYARLYGKPNVYGARIPIKSSWNIQLCTNLASSVSDREVVQFLTYGWPLNHDGRPATINTTNHSSAIRYPQQVQQYISKELNANCLLGPYVTPPWDQHVAVSPMSTRPKKDTWKRRIIMDLSWPKDGRSVNAGVSADKYLHQPMILVYPTIDYICRHAAKYQPGELLGYKKDMDRAFQQVPMDLCDWPLLGITWSGAYFWDKTAMMGSRSAPYCMQRTTSFIRHVMRNLDFFLANYVDDFIGVDTRDKVWRSYNVLTNLLRDIGATEAEEKSVPPAEEVEILGVLFNFLLMTISITPSRLLDIQTELNIWATKQEYTLKQLQRLVGKLQFGELMRAPRTSNDAAAHRQIGTST